MVTTELAMESREIFREEACAVTMPPLSELSPTAWEQARALFAEAQVSSDVAGHMAYCICCGARFSQKRFGRRRRASLWTRIVCEVG